MPIRSATGCWGEADPVLAGGKIIAEAWDAAGLYQVGSFIGDSWQEWNGKFRDDVRSFLKGDPDTVSVSASRLLASPDIYGHKEREPEQRINFITCHDGFTLNDLVTYNSLGSRLPRTSPDVTKSAGQIHDPYDVQYLLGATGIRDPHRS